VLHKGRGLNAYIVRRFNNGFWLLLVCVVGIAKDGPVGLVTFYEQDVQDRVVELGLTTKEKIKKSATIAGISLFLPVIIVVPIMVYCYNGAKGFVDGFTQMTIIYMIMNIFDRLFVDEWWVCRTNAWLIPGTEDLKPYITNKVRIVKWVKTCIGFPVLAVIIAGIVNVVGK
jgi:hypothetical protein